MTSALALCRSSIERHSKSFALASKLLPPRSRDAAQIVYAWCRRVDDSVDLASPITQAQAIAALSQELSVVYGSGNGSREGSEHPIAAAFGRIVAQKAIPRRYPEELLAGMRMDAESYRYGTWADLLLYCYRVAGTVGLMMCHVLGVRESAALRYAAHLGIAMQLTNIARDVFEDWERGRLYLPDSLLAEVGAPCMRDALGGPFPEQHAAPVRLAVQRLLEEAAMYYRSADRGLASLSWRAAFAVRAARLIYADIGRQVARRHYDVLLGRAYVSAPRKIWLVLRAAAMSFTDWPARLSRPFVPAPRLPLLSTADDVFSL